jgi:hypothetical protein
MRWIQQSTIEFTLDCYPSLLEFKELVTTSEPPRLVVNPLERELEPDNQYMAYFIY